MSVVRFRKETRKALAPSAPPSKKTLKTASARSSSGSRSASPTSLRSLPPSYPPVRRRLERTLRQLPGAIAEKLVAAVNGLLDLKPSDRVSRQVHINNRLTVALLVGATRIPEIVALIEDVIRFPEGH